MKDAGQYLRCGQCGEIITKETEYQFLDISEDLLGRDVVKFMCFQCNSTTESLVYIVPVEE